MTVCFTSKNKDIYMKFKTRPPFIEINLKGKTNSPKENIENDLPAHEGDDFEFLDDIFDENNEEIPSFDELLDDDCSDVDHGVINDDVIECASMNSDYSKGLRERACDLIEIISKIKDMADMPNAIPRESINLINKLLLGLGDEGKISLMTTRESVDLAHEQYETIRNQKENLENLYQNRINILEEEVCYSKKLLSSSFKEILFTTNEKLVDEFIVNNRFMKSSKVNSSKAFYRALFSATNPQSWHKNVAGVGEGTSDALRKYLLEREPHSIEAFLLNLNVEASECRKFNVESVRTSPVIINLKVNEENFFVTISKPELGTFYELRLVSYDGSFFESDFFKDLSMTVIE